MVIDPKTFLPNIGKLLIEPDVIEEKTAGGLFIPASAEQGSNRVGTCLCSAEAKVVNGCPISMPFVKGDKVLFDSLGTNKLKHGGKEYFIVRVEDVIGTLQ